MPGSPNAPGRFESIQALLNIARDGLFLVVILMLLLLPGTVNRILIEAGFTRASILGFDWETKIDQAAEQTQAAKLEVDRLNNELGAYAARIDQVAQSVSEPAARAQAFELARNIRASRMTAEAAGAQLGNNLTAQRELKSELRARIQSKVP